MVFGGRGRVASALEVAFYEPNQRSIVVPFIFGFLRLVHIRPDSSHSVVVVLLAVQSF